MVLVIFSTSSLVLSLSLHLIGWMGWLLERVDLIGERASVAAANYIPTLGVTPIINHQEYWLNKLNEGFLLYIITNMHILLHRSHIRGHTLIHYIIINVSRRTTLYIEGKQIYKKTNACLFYALLLKIFYEIYWIWDTIWNMFWVVYHYSFFLKIF